MGAHLADSDGAVSSFYRYGQELRGKKCAERMNRWGAQQRNRNSEKGHVELLEVRGTGAEAIPGQPGRRLQMAGEPLSLGGVA